MSPGKRIILSLSDLSDLPDLAQEKIKIMYYKNVKRIFLYHAVAEIMLVCY